MNIEIRQTSFYKNGLKTLKIEEQKLRLMFASEGFHLGILVMWNRLETEYQKFESIMDQVIEFIISRRRKLWLSYYVAVINQLKQKISTKLMKFY